MAAEMLEIGPVSRALGGEVRGLSLNQSLFEETIREIYAAWLEYQVLIFRDQDLDVDDQRRVTGYFGQSQDLMRTAPTQRQATREVMYIGNVSVDGIQGDLPHGDMQFHTDGAYFEHPTKATLLYGVQIPSWGGDTLFANGYKAFASLPAALRVRIERLQALNVYDYGSGGTKRNLAPAPDAPRFTHPVVIVHPETGRKSLYVNRLMTQQIVGLEGVESDALLETLFAAVEQPGNIYAHKWRPRDLIVWDNRCTFHARTDFDPNEKRALRRMTTKSDRPMGVPASRA
jgi:taurine dioxygenase